MLIKVCGLRSSEDLAATAASGADMVGMIFYPLSPRYAGGNVDEQLLELFTRSYPNMKRVGVFVDAEEDEVRITAEKYQLNTLQFHGGESPEYCSLFKENYRVIKAFAVENENDFEITTQYEGACDYFLFDTAGPLYGGNGASWDWSLLAHYTGNVPFLVSGGIGPADVLKVGAIRHPQFAGIDINSGFEKYPGAKNTEAIKSFIRIIKAGEYELFGQ